MHPSTTKLSGRALTTKLQSVLVKMSLPLHDKNQVFSLITCPYTLYFAADELWEVTRCYFKKQFQMEHFKLHFFLKSNTSDWKRLSGTAEILSSTSIVLLQLTMDTNSLKAQNSFYTELCLLYIFRNPVTSLFIKVRKQHSNYFY